MSADHPERIAFFVVLGNRSFCVCPDIRPVLFYHLDPDTVSTVFFQVPVSILQGKSTEIGMYQFRPLVKVCFELIRFVTEHSVHPVAEIYLSGFDEPVKYSVVRGLESIFKTMSKIPEFVIALF